MKLTAVLNLPPKFLYWKEFGAGKKRRIPYTKQWWDIWRYEIGRKKVIDHTLPLHMLPPNSRLMDAEDFMTGPIDALPDELLRMKNDNTLIDHPWPYNIKLDPKKNQELQYTYTIDTRFYIPRDDCLVLTNTVLETDKLKAMPPFEPTDEHINTINRQYEWATKGDTVLVRQPKARQFPRINLKPQAKFGVSKERQETSIMSSFDDYSQNLVAQYYHKLQNREQLSEILDRKTIAFPHCLVPLERDSRKINLQLCIDIMSLSRQPLPQINLNPHNTVDKNIPNIKPRTWRSILEQTRNYEPNWSFTLPRNSFLNTIHLASRIIRVHRNTDEMLARSIMHAYGLGNQYARLKCYENKVLASKFDESKQASAILQNPMDEETVRQNDRKEFLEKPIVLQAIGFELPMGNFHFTRYQLNTTNLSGQIKNQAWYSGPISDLTEALRYYLDFQSFDQAKASETLSPTTSPSSNSVEIGTNPVT